MISGRLESLLEAVEFDGRAAEFVDCGALPSDGAVAVACAKAGLASNEAIAKTLAAESALVVART